MSSRVSGSGSNVTKMQPIFLSGLRFKTVERTFDPRDYASDNPLGFSNYVTKYLITKKGMKSFRDIKRNLGKAVAVWENRNIKAIGYAEIEDFLLTLDYLAGKTQHNILSDLHSFFTWACKREKKLDMPEFPAFNTNSAGGQSSRRKISLPYWARYMT